MRDGIDSAGTVEGLERKCFVGGVCEKATAKYSTASGSNPQPSIRDGGRRVACSKQTFRARGHEVVARRIYFWIGYRCPRFSSVMRYAYPKRKVASLSRISATAMSWIAKDESMVWIDEKQRVEEAVIWSIGIGEEKFPRLAAVGGFVKTRLIAGAAGHDDGGVFIERLNAAKVELLSAWRDRTGLPQVSAVFGAEDSAIGAAGPRDSTADVVNAAQAGGSVGLFDIPLSIGAVCGLCCRQNEGQEERNGSHLLTSV